MFPQGNVAYIKGHQQFSKYDHLLSSRWSLSKLQSFKGFQFTSFYLYCSDLAHFKLLAQNHIYHVSGHESQWQQAKHCIPDIPLTHNVFHLLQVRWGIYLSVQLTLSLNVVKKKTLGLLHFTISCVSESRRLQYDEDDSTMLSAKHNLSFPPSVLWNCVHECHK